MKKKILYDGTCPMCSSIAGAIGKTERAKDFEFIDIHGDTDLKAYKDLRLNDEIHVIGEDGKIEKNADGILSILSEYRGLSWLPWFGRLPVIRTMLRSVYNVIARNRHKLFKKSH